jgi:hypothetical protein
LAGFSNQTCADYFAAEAEDAAAGAEAAGAEAAAEAAGAEAAGAEAAEAAAGACSPPQAAKNKDITAAANNDFFISLNLN